MQRDPNQPSTKTVFTVLIVDDHEPFRDLLKDALRTAFPFMAVREASNGAEALHQIELGLPDLIFMDIRLPGESGLQLTKKIKSQHPDVVIAIITNHDQPEYRQAAQRNGASYFLSKKSSSTDDILTLAEAVFAAKHPHVHGQMTTRRLGATPPSPGDAKPPRKPPTPAPKSPKPKGPGDKRGKPSR